MRTVDRRDQLLRLLRRRADWTAAGLARELGVSRRTVLRDLGGLREAGFELTTFSGPGGGVRLNPTSVMITSQLRASEVIALIVSAEIARAAKTVPFAAGAEHALAKIEQALPLPGPPSYGRCASESWSATRPRTRGPLPSTRPWSKRSRPPSPPPACSPSPTVTTKGGPRNGRSNRTACWCARRCGMCSPGTPPRTRPGSSAPTASAPQPSSATPSSPGPATWSPACAPTPGRQQPPRARPGTPNHRTTRPGSQPKVTAPLDRRGR
jgi:biotin operon repressor